MSENPVDVQKCLVRNQGSVTGCAVNGVNDNIRGYSERWTTLPQGDSKKKVVEMSGIEPLTYTLRTYRSPN